MGFSPQEFYISENFLQGKSWYDTLVQIALEVKEKRINRNELESNKTKKQIYIFRH